MKRFEVWLARLDLAEGSGMQKTRLVAVVSPDEMNNPTSILCLKAIRPAGNRDPA
jgi:mRNA-degrading endonuclease toxin of MazEF toxin-antitoxin module